MDLFPPTYDLPMDLDDGTVYTDIPVDPASLPVDTPADPAPDMDAPLAPFVLSDEEMEEEEMEEEEDPEEDPEEEPQMDPTSDDDIVEPIPIDEESSDHAPSDDEPSDHVPSEDDQSDPSSDDPTSPVATPPADTLPAPPVTITPAFEPVMTPSSTFTYQFPPRLGGPRVVRTPRKRVRFTSTDYASTSRASPPPSPATDLYHTTPHPAYTPSPTPSPARETLLSAPNQIAPVSPRSPHPTLIETTDPAISSLRDNAYAVGNRVSQIERNLTELPGPDNFNDLEGRVQIMGRRMDHLGGQVYAMERRIADQVRDLRIREGADRVEIHNLRRRLQILEDKLSGMHYSI